MKPMAALIATGIVFMLIMLYYGNKYFDGVVEKNIFANSEIYNQTAPEIINIEKNIHNVRLIKNDSKITLSYNIDTDSLGYKDLMLKDVYLSVPSYTKTYHMDNNQGIYETSENISNGFYSVVFVFTLKNNTLKVMKTASLG